MRAITVHPGAGRSLRIDDVPDPPPAGDELLVRGLAVGVCGTDKEIVRGDYGWAPPGRERRNGRYTERGIKELDGYASELWTVPARFAVKVAPHLGLAGVLTEPTSVVAKAWEQVERIGARAWFEPQTVLVTGAGPVGLLAALIGRQRGLDVHVLDRLTDGPKPELVRDLGATYHHTSVDEVAAGVRPDIVIEGTGVGQLVFDAIASTGSYGIVCLTGVSPVGRPLQVDAGGINRSVVLENDAVVGSVNANLRHYRHAAEALAQAEPRWLHRLITSTVPLAEAADAFERPPGHDVKVVITLDDSVTRS